MFKLEGIECGPCNDGICDWMPCTLKWLGCICDENGCAPPNTTDQGSEMATPTKKVVKQEVEATLSNEEKEASADEIVKNGVTFDYAGYTYTVPPGKEWPLEVVEAQEDGRMLGFVKELLGKKDYAEMRKTCKVTQDLNDFLDAMLGAIDLDTGK